MLRRTLITLIILAVTGLTGCVEKQEEITGTAGAALPAEVPPGGAMPAAS